MTRLRLLQLSLSHFRVPRGFMAVRLFSYARVLKNHWLHNTPPIINQPAKPNSPKTVHNEEIVDIKFQQSQEIFGQLVEKVSEKKYKEIVPILSNYRRQKKLLSNPHLLSLISLIINVKDINLKGIAYEVYLLYNSEILSDLRGYPNDLLEMLLEIVYYYEDSANFDILLSQYLNCPALDKDILSKALKLYIDSSNIELAKQLLYQVISYYSQNDIEISSGILEVFLRKLVHNGANFNNIEFGYNIWVQRGLPVTPIINDLMLVALIDSQQTNKLNNFILKLEKEDPRVLEFNDFLNNSRGSTFITKLESLMDTFQNDKKYFYFRVISHIDDIPLLMNGVVPSILKQCGTSAELLLSVAKKLSKLNVTELTKFIDSTIIPLGVFNYRFFALLCRSYISQYPDATQEINIAYQDFLEKSFDSKMVYWYAKLSDIGFSRVNGHYKLTKYNHVKVMNTLNQIDSFEIPIEEKVQKFSNSLSRFGLQPREYLYKYLSSKYESPLLNSPEEVKYVEKLMLSLCEENHRLSTELLIVKKHVQLQYMHFAPDPLDRVKKSKELILAFLVKHANDLDIKLLCQLCDIYINIKEFDISGKIIEQVLELRSKKVPALCFEKSNYDALMIARLEFKQVILSFNYLKIIETILDFKKRDDLKMRKFFFRLIKRDLKFLQKHNSRLQRKEVKDLNETKEAMVVEKMCIYLSNFVDDLLEEYKKETKEMTDEFRSKLNEYKDYCK